VAFDDSTGQFTFDQNGARFTDTGYWYIEVTFTQKIYPEVSATVTNDFYIREPCGVGNELEPDNADLDAFANAPTSILELVIGLDDV